MFAGAARQLSHTRREPEYELISDTMEWLAQMDEVIECKFNGALDIQEATTPPEIHYEIDEADLCVSQIFKDSTLDFKNHTIDEQYHAYDDITEETVSCTYNPKPAAHPAYTPSSCLLSSRRGRNET